MYFDTPPQLRRLLVLLLAMAIVSLAPALGLAQGDQGRVVGTVSDANGGVVPGATVVIKNEKTGEERTVTTNESGYYSVTALKPSAYTVSATAQNLTVHLTNV